MSYSTYLQSHKALSDVNTIQPWKGSVYLPPCTCHTSTKCAESCSAKAYDFSKFADVHMNDLVDLCKFLNCSETNTLCKKYSLSIDPSLLVNMNKIQRTEMIRKLPEFTTKRKLLQNDLKVLFPLSGSTF